MVSVSTSLTLRWSGCTDKGRFRANNEDAFLALTFDSREVRYLGKIGEGTLATEDYVFAVSDGMGGAKSGEFASKIATEKITKLLPKSFKQSAQGLASGFNDVLGELFDAIHKELTAMGRWYEECRDMGATLSLCWFTPEWMFFGHLGDSRIYYLPHDGPLKQITDDHTFVGFQRRQGQLNEREARNHPRRNVLQKSLGAGHQFIDPHIGAVGVAAGDRFLICSDGVVDGLWDSGIESRLRQPLAAGETLAQRLVQHAIAEGSRDNVTALVIEVLPAAGE
jgi:protein phosphatase